ncbi:MAG: hypothetical protein AAB426_03340, partial [Myxococcota bacterium]
PKAVRLEGDANRAAKRANTFLALGSVAAAAAASTLSLLWFQPAWLGDSHVALVASPTTTGLHIAGAW